MSKIKEIAKEQSTWAIGVPSLIVGVMTLLDADKAEQVASTVSSAGQSYVETGNYLQALGFLGMGLLGVFMQGRE